jgi:hypothetical protein
MWSVTLCPKEITLSGFHCACEKNIKKNLTENLVLQWAPLNGITDYGTNRLMGSNLSYLTNPKLPFPTNVCLVDSLIRINRLLESISLCPKVIPISGAHFNIIAFFIILQWLTLHRITDNVINWLMGSNASWLISSKLLCHA